jgi:DNA-binding response OmpR family regulator
MGAETEGCQPVSPMTTALDREFHVLTGPGGEVRLPPPEFSFLALLEDRAGKLVPRWKVASQLYGHRIDGGPLYAQTMTRMYLCRIRRALRQVDSDWCITTIPAVGYVLSTTPR